MLVYGDAPLRLAMDPPSISKLQESVTIDQHYMTLMLDPNAATTTDADVQCVHALTKVNGFTSCYKSWGCF